MVMIRPVVPPGPIFLVFVFIPISLIFVVIIVVSAIFIRLVASLLPIFVSIIRVLMAFLIIDANTYFEVILSRCMIFEVYFDTF